MRKPQQAKRAKLRNSIGDLVESSEWAEVMATHLETVQWQVRPCGLVDGPALGGPWPVEDGDISEKEVAVAVRALRLRRAAGNDSIPAELLRPPVEDEGVFGMADGNVL